MAWVNDSIAQNAVECKIFIHASNLNSILVDKRQIISEALNKNCLLYLANGVI